MFFRVFLFLARRTIGSKIPKSLGKKITRRNSNVMLFHELRRKKKDGFYILEYINGKSSPLISPSSEVVALFKSTVEKNQEEITLFIFSDF